MPCMVADGCTKLVNDIIHETHQWQDRPIGPLCRGHRDADIYIVNFQFVYSPTTQYTLILFVHINYLVYIYIAHI